MLIVLRENSARHQHDTERSQKELVAEKLKKESSKSSTERLIVETFGSACLHGECMTAKITNHSQRQLPVILSSLLPSHGLMLSLVIH